MTQRIVRPEPRSRDTCFFVNLPVPPSANALNRNATGKGRVLTPEYTRWQRDAGLLLNAAVGDSLPSGPWGVSLEARIPHERDIDNLVKPANDLLVSCGIIDDDKYIEQGEYARVPEGKASRLKDGEMRIGVYSMLLAWPDFDTAGEHRGLERRVSYVQRGDTKHVLTGGGLDAEIVYASDLPDPAPLKGEV